MTVSKLRSPQNWKHLHTISCCGSNITKVKFSPWHAYECTEGRSKYCRPLIHNPALEGGQSAPRSHSFTTGKDLVPITQEALRASLDGMKNLTPKQFNPWTLLPIANCSTNYQLLTNHSNMWFWDKNTFQNETGYISSPRVTSSVLRILCTVSPCCLSFCIAAYVTASFVWLDSIRDTNEWYLVSYNTT